MEIEKYIQELEERLLRSDVRASKSELEQLLADGFTEFGSSGRIWNKKDIISSLVAESDKPAVSLMTSDFSVTLLAPDVALARYRCSRKNTAEITERTTIRSSLWRLIDGNWQMYFHQGTVETGSE